MSIGTPLPQYPHCRGELLPRPAAAMSTCPLFVVAALALAEKNFRVLPCRPGTKIPATARGVLDATTDTRQITEWWTAMPDANVAIATGNDLIGLDVDTKNGHDGEASLRKLANDNHALPETLEQRTPSGGRHLLFRKPGAVVVRNSAGKYGDGVDVRGEGGCLVVAPSIVDGKSYGWINKCELAPAPAWLLQLISGSSEYRAEPAGTVAEGQRNATLTSLAGTMRARGMAPETIETALIAENINRCNPPLEEREVRQIAASVSRYSPNDCERLTDYGNAERLVRRHGSNIRHCRRGHGWMVYDGRRWVPDPAAVVERLAKDTVRSMLHEAAAIGDDKKRNLLLSWIKASESENRLRAMVRLAESEPSVPAQMADFNPDPWLFNCMNGTVDLRTGELRPHRREDLITKLSPVDYEPNARLPAWDEFLNQATNGDAAFIAYLQRAVGYTLTGLTSEEKLFFAHGPAATGKTTFLEAVKSVLGDYAMTSDFESFLVQRFGGGVRNDIARLAGARMVAAAEADEGRRFDAGLIKQLTGGDMVTARFLFHESFEFRPQFKLWLAANHAPRIDESDSAMWRRVRKLPFEHAISEERRDPKVKAQLSNPKVAGPAILAWAVCGCLEWQRDGLKEPEAVTKSTSGYRQEMDVLADWIEECCERDPETKTTSHDLYASFSYWAKECNLGRWLNKKTFSERLATHGFERYRDKRTRGYRGIRLISQFDDAPGVEGGPDANPGA